VNRVGRSVVVVWGLSLLVTTALRVPIWTDARLVWAEATVESPHKPRVWINYGNALEAAGDRAGAEAAYQTALVCAASPARADDEQRLGTAIASINLGLLKWDAGHHAAGERYVRAAIEAAPHVHDGDAVLQWMQTPSAHD
jgi:tetratricopeptide (TPR) repeat protein